MKTIHTVLLAAGLVAGLAPHTCVDRLAPKSASGATASFRRLERMTASHPLLKCGSGHEADSGYSCGSCGR